jgi:hypothetical protein
LRLITERLIVVLAVAASVAIGAFLLAVIVPPLFFQQSVPSEYVVYIRIVLFFAATICIFAVGPVIVYQFRQSRKLQDAINHYIKNKMQEIVLAVDLVESNLIKADTQELKYEEKIQMLEDVRAICKDVSGNLAERILAEAPKFSHNVVKPQTELSEIKPSQNAPVPEN